MSSVERAPFSPDVMPGAFSAMWRALRRGYAAEPRLLVVSFGLTLAAALPDALIAFGIAWLGDAVLAGQRTLILACALGLGTAATGTWFLHVSSDRVQRRFRDRLTIALESEVALLQASVVGLEHQERPEYLNRLSVLRHQVFVLDHMYMSLFSTCGWLLRLGVSVALLASIHPLLALLAPCALPTLLCSAWRPGVERAAEERGAPESRLARHLFTTATSSPPGKEVRVLGLQQRLLAQRRAAWERGQAPLARARWVSAVYQALAWALFAAGFLAAVAFALFVLRVGPGPLLLLLVAGSRLSAYVGATIGEIGFLRGIWLDGSKRLAWLEDYANAEREHALGSVPSELGRGIELEAVSFTYPGTSRAVLEDVSLRLEPGTVVAIVGENGAGKSSLVKLLCKLYAPTRGRILVDGQDLAQLPAEAWRARLAGAFQDFFRFEFRARESVGIGDLPHAGDVERVANAVERAGATEVIAALQAGLDTQLGPTWPAGIELSFGQWQKLALARGFMRPRPLLLILDEPTAALDAETEHALFERFAAAARGTSSQITLLVSHRFSTVKMADQIVVLSGSRIAQQGQHEELMAAGGPYAELYNIQAAAYR